MSRVNKQMKRCSISSTIKETQILNAKIAPSVHLNGSIKRKAIPNVGKNARQLETIMVGRF